MVTWQPGEEVQEAVGPTKEERRDEIQKNSQEEKQYKKLKMRRRKNKNEQQNEKGHQKKPTSFIHCLMN
jgi:hypothetical protein